MEGLVRAEDEKAKAWWPDFQDPFQEALHGGSSMDERRRHDAETLDTGSGRCHQSTLDEEVHCGRARYCKNPRVQYKGSLAEDAVGPCNGCLGYGSMG